MHFSQTQVSMVLELLTVHIPLYFALLCEQRTSGTANSAGTEVPDP